MSIESNKYQYVSINLPLKYDIVHKYIVDKINDFSTIEAAMFFRDTNTENIYTEYIRSVCSPADLNKNLELNVQLSKTLKNIYDILIPEKNIIYSDTKRKFINYEYPKESKYNRPFHVDDVNDCQYITEFKDGIYIPVHFSIDQNNLKNFSLKFMEDEDHKGSYYLDILKNNNNEYTVDKYSDDEFNWIAILLKVNFKAHFIDCSNNQKFELDCYCQNYDCDVGCQLYVNNNNNNNNNSNIDTNDKNHTLKYYNFSRDYIDYLSDGLFIKFLE